ncbi:MAG: transcriptional repressor LexA [Elusimicrobia bacterium]|nr:transcriptional repressor LexA [Elusimicrobiota bacterium]
MDQLTARQKEIYTFIVNQIEKSGIPPTVREIAKHFDVFPKAIQDHISALERKGVLRRAKETARGLLLGARRLVEAQSRLPILGRVSAGVPLEAIAEVEDYLAVDEAIAKRANFVLRVKGDSMSPELLDGDMVLVQNTTVAEDRAIVVATVDDEEATVKRLRRVNREIFLEPINSAYPLIRGRKVSVIGKVTSVIRTYF